MIFLPKNPKERWFKMLEAKAEDIRERLDRVMRRLMPIAVEGQSARLNAPILYPSGSACTIEIVFNKDRCFVSDLGMGHFEAEMSGAESFYDKSARAAVEKYGVGFDGLSVFAAWASPSKLESAVTLVANASVFAAQMAVLRAEEEKDRQRNSELYEKVSHIFGLKSVEKSREIQGRDDVWNAHNVVAMPKGRIAVFEFVSTYQNSVANKFLMFSDLAKKDSGYSLNSVVRDIGRIGKRGSMLADVSNIIQLDAAREQFEKYASAA